MKVVSSSEMARIEKGYDERAFMENAGKGIAARTEDFVTARDLDKVVTLFVGKGNNGGDAFAAGVMLIKKGFLVTAFYFYPLEECSSLCKLQHQRFKDAGGVIITDKFPEVETGVILDGLVGTGFHGKAEGILLDAIKRANRSKIPIIAIDIPSALEIHATLTIYLGLPKIEFFIGDGWNHVGKLIGVDFGLPSEAIDQACPVAELINEKEIKQYIPEIKRDQHKYQRGYVVAVAGSSSMSGAALLSSFATLRSGAGIVRLFHFDDITVDHPEIIHEKVSKDRIFEETKRAKALFIGPGLGRTPEAKEIIVSLLEHVTLPCVIDADALFFLPGKLPPHAILTPHHGEMEKLLAGKYANDLIFLEAAQEFVEKRNVTVVLKGAPTFILHPGKVPLIIPRGDPGMATAGSGDVLTGVIAAFLAQGATPYVAASLGVYIHGIAGEFAAEEKTSHCVVASDIIDYLPKVLKLITEATAEVPSTNL